MAYVVTSRTPSSATGLMSALCSTGSRSVCAIHVSWAFLPFEVEHVALHYGGALLAFFVAQCALVVGFGVDLGFQSCLISASLNVHASNATASGVAAEPKGQTLFATHF